MNKKVLASLFSCAFFLLNTAVFAESITDLNEKLSQAVAQKKWDLAIQIVDRMIVVTPEKASKLKVYRSELKRISESSITPRNSSPDSSFNANLPSRGPSIEKIKSALFSLEVYTNSSLPEVRKYYQRCQAWIHTSSSSSVSIKDCNKHAEIKNEVLDEILKYLPDFISAQEKRCFNQQTNDDCQWTRNQIIRIKKKYRAMKDDEY
jgi:hypothetical protein